MARLPLTSAERAQVHELQIDLGAIKPCIGNWAHAAGVWQPVAAFRCYGDQRCAPCAQLMAREIGIHSAGSRRYTAFARALAQGRGWNGQEIPRRSIT